MLHQPVTQAQLVIPDKPSIDFSGPCLLCQEHMDEMRWQFVEDDLSLSRESLCRLGMGFSPNSGAYTFPMRDHEGQVVGVRLRYPNGKKMSARGSKNALFYESCPDYGLVLITEGPTDTAAVLGLGFPAIGRPSCNGGRTYLHSMLCWKHDVVIVSDNDKAGREGSAGLAKVLKSKTKNIRIFTPPKGKDIKDWITVHGANRSMVEYSIKQAKQA